MAKETKSEDWKINHLEIKNFKSIKELSIDPARVNIFVGTPNAGKSNILEALAFLSFQFDIDKKIPIDFIRYSTISSLFYYYNIKDDISLIKNDKHFSLIYDNNIDYLCTEKVLNNETDRSVESVMRINQDGTVTGLDLKFRSQINKYHFKSIPLDGQKSLLLKLEYDGSNIWQIIRHSADLKKFASSFVQKFDLKILFESNSDKFDLMKLEGDSYTRLDFVLTPDTFQRMLYYLAAIDSNKNSVLLFEEPEAHSFPPYIQELTERILDDKNNQYFITTHSPFVVEKMLERAGTEDDVKIFVTYYKDHQTKVHELSRKQIDQILDYNVDLFFNMEAYQND